jgi:methylenetetrahydrofolate reductase (NADPH)
MPIQTYAAFKRRTDFAKTIVPQQVWDMLEPIKDDDLKVREFGTKFVADMCRKILSADIGINGIHICELGAALRLRRGAEC